MERERGGGGIKDERRDGKEGENGKEKEFCYTKHFTGEKVSWKHKLSVI